MPDDVSVIGMDGLVLSALTIVDRVLARLADPGLAPDEFLFMPELITRESVAAPPAATRRHTP